MLNTKELKIPKIAKVKFSDVVGAAKAELDQIRSQSTELEPREFWSRIDIFYDKYPLVVMEALELMMIDEFLLEQQRRANYQSN